jgi:methyl-accepting chemotaxis protein
MKTDKPYKRKLLNFSIKRDMQFKMIGKIFLLLFISLLLSGAIFYQFANQEVTNSFQMFHVKARNFLDFLFPVIFSSFAISLVIGTIGSLFFPKPIAGGLYRIEEELQKVVDNEDFTVRIVLRENDQVTSLATQINKVLALADMKKNREET